MAKVKVRKGTEAVHYFFRTGATMRRTLYVAWRKASRPRLTAERWTTARQLRSTASFAIARDAGYRLFDAGRFAEAAEIVEAARRVTLDADTMHRLAKARKPFFAAMFDPKTIALDSPFMRLALNPDVVAGVSAYLGCVPLLQYINLFYSSHVEHEPQKSQLYHCDSDDTTQVKIFVHCSDVTPQNGPLTIIGARESDRLRRRLGYRFDHRVTDAEAADAVRADEQVLVGGPGTTCFVDTSRCFHYGSRVGEDAGPRVIAMIQYLTPYSFILPGDPRRSARFRHLATPALPRLSRMVLGAE